MQVHEYLLKHADVGHDYWSAYNNAKYDIELNLKSGLRNMLIKDYKTYAFLKGEVGIGVASIVVPLGLMHKHFGIDTVCSEMDQLMKERNLGMFSIVTNYPDEHKNYHRELLVYENPHIYSGDDLKFEELVKHLDQHQGYQLRGKEVIEQTNKSKIQQWDVGNLAYSRKDLEVLLKQFYEQ